MDTNEKALLQQMVEMIVREVAPETIILFGSRARGDARPDSDIDLLVVEKKPFSPQRSRRKEAARLYMALRGLADGWSVEDIIESYPHITREDF
ncbi:MAG: nucleotidyltransferase domain-containing protein [Sulfuricellaceae bacterium]